MLARKEKKTIGFTLSHDCWIGTNGDILMLDPVNHDVATTDTFTHFPAGTPLPPGAWDIDKLYGLGQLY